MPKITSRPFTLTTGLLLYALLDLTLVGVALLVLFGRQFRGEESAFGVFIGSSLVAAALVVAFEIVRVYRGHRSGRRTLVYVSLLAVVLLVFRRNAAFYLLALLGAGGAILMWLPATSAFFQQTEPRPQRLRKYARATHDTTGRYARAAHEAASVWRRKG